MPRYEVEPDRKGGYQVRVIGDLNVTLQIVPGFPTAGKAQDWIKAQPPQTGTSSKGWT